MRWGGHLGSCSRAAQSSWRCGWSLRKCSWKMRWSCGWWKGPTTTSCCNGVGATGRKAEEVSQVSCGHPHPPRGHGRWYFKGGEDSYSPPATRSQTLGGGTEVLPLLPLHCTPQVLRMPHWTSSCSLGGTGKGRDVLFKAKYQHCRFSWGRRLVTSVRLRLVAFRLVTGSNSQS